MAEKGSITLNHAEALIIASALGGLIEVAVDEQWDDAPFEPSIPLIDNGTCCFNDLWRLHASFQQFLQGFAPTRKGK